MGGSEGRVLELLERLKGIRACNDVGGYSLELFRELKDEVGTINETSTLETVCAKILDKGSEVTKFLNDNVSDKEQQDAVKEGFEFLTLVLRKMEEGGLLHANREAIQWVAEISIHTARNHKAEKCYSAAFEPLLVIFASFPEGPLLTNYDIVKDVIDNLLADCAKAKSTSNASKSTWKKKAFKLMGMLCMSYSDVVRNNYFSKQQSKPLWRAYVDRVVKALSEGSDAENSFLAGCFDGLNFFLESFEEEAKNDAAEFKEGGEEQRILRVSYTAVCNVIASTVEGVDSRRYAKVVAALKLLSNHSSLLALYFHINPKMSCVTVFQGLLSCTKHKNKDVVKGGLDAIDAWLGCLHIEMKKDSEVLRELLGKFCELFQCKDQVSDVLVAMRGFGALAPLMGDDERLRDWFEQCGKFVEEILTGQRESEIDLDSQLPAVMTALADMILEMKDTSALTTRPLSDILDKIFTALFQNYCEIHSTKQYLYERSWFYLLFALDKGGTGHRNALMQMLQRTMLGAISMTIKPSDQWNASPPGVLPVGAQKPQPCVKYTKLWINLSCSGHGKWLARRGRSGCDSYTQIRISGTVYGQMFLSITEIIDRLDLSITTPLDEEDAAESGDMGHCFHADPTRPVFVVQASGMSGCERPNNQRDFDMFLNLVLFFQRVTTKTIKPEFFKSTYYELCKALVRGSTKHPLVSGYFKILASSMRLIEQGGFFAGVGTRNDTSMDVQNVVVKVDSEAELCCNLISNFAREVIARSDKIFDDLLASCLDFVLCLPSHKRNFEVQIPALQAALKMGVDDPNMAIRGLECLEKWVMCDVKQLSKHLQSILPFLSDLIGLPSLYSEDFSVRNIIESSEVKRRRAVAQSKRLATRQKFNKDDDDGIAGAGIKDIALRTIKLLGKLGSESRWLVPQKQQREFGENTYFDTGMRILKVDIHGANNIGSRRSEERSAEFTLDQTLPRVAYLAERSVDRKLKVAACEFLQAITVLAIGKHHKAVCQNSLKELQSYRKLFQFLLPVILRLAVSVEVVAAQLFEPLVNQIVHWFTSAGGMESEADLLLDSVLNCLEFSSDGKVREGSSKILSEYVSWTLRGLSTHKKQDEAIKPRKMLLRLYSLMNHPNVGKRMGAYLAVRELGSRRDGLRIHSAVVDQFLLELMHNVILSLNFASRDDPALQTSKYAESALMSLKQILLDDSNNYCLTLMAPREQGLMPRRLHPDLRHFVEWLFEQIGSHDKSCRKYCRDLFTELCGKLDTPPRTWVQQKKDLVAKIFSEDLRTLSFEEDCIETKLAHLKYLTTALDNFEWVIRTSFLFPADVFREGSPLSGAINIFIRSEGMLSESVTPREYVRYQNMKSNTTYALLKFIATLLDTWPEDEKAKEESNRLVSEPFLKIMFVSLLAPKLIQLDVVSDPVVLEEIPKQIERLVRALSSKHDFLRERSAAVLSSMLNRGDFLSKLLIDLEIDLVDVWASDFSSDELCILFSGYRRLRFLGFLPSPYCNGERLLTTAWNVFCNHTTPGNGRAPALNMCPARKSVLQSMLRLSFSLVDGFGPVWDRIFVKGNALDPTGWQDSKGWTFYILFRDQILEFMASKIASDEVQIIIFKDIFNMARNSSAVAEILVNLLESHVALVFDSQCTSMTWQNMQTNKVLDTFFDNFEVISNMVVQCKNQDGYRGLEQVINLLDKLLQLRWLDKLVRLRSESSGELSVSILTQVGGALLNCLRTFHRENKNDWDCDMKTCIQRVFKVFPSVLDKVHKANMASLVVDLIESVKGLFDQYLQNPREGGSYPDIFCAFLKAVSNCKTLAIVPLLNQIVIKTEDRSLEEQRGDALDHYILGIQEVDALSVLRDLVNDQVSPLEIHRAKMENIGLRIVERLSEDNLVTSFVAQSDEFVRIMESTCANDSGALPILNQKICVLILLKAIYHRLSWSIIQEKVHPKNKTLTAKLISAIASARKMYGSCPEKCAAGSSSSWRENEALRPMVYLFYHTLENTHAEILYQRYASEPDKFEIIFKKIAWENIVDVEQRHPFDVEPNFDETRNLLDPFRWKQNMIKDTKKVSLPDFADVEALVYGSLTQKVSESLQSFASFQGKSSMVSPTSVGYANDITLEDDGPNGFNNECMRQFISVIDRISQQSNRSTIQDQTHSSGQEMPKWMAVLRDKLQSDGQNKNVRFFIAKLIINIHKRSQKAGNAKMDVFQPFAAEFFEGFFHQRNGLVHRVTESDRSVGSQELSHSFNYFMREICHLWIHWTEDAGEPVLNSDQKVEMGWEFIKLLTSLTMHNHEAIPILAYFYRKWRKLALQNHINDCLEETNKCLGQVQDLMGPKAKTRMEAGLKILCIITAIEAEHVQDQNDALLKHRIDPNMLKSAFEAAYRIAAPSEQVMKKNDDFKKLALRGLKACALILACANLPDKIRIQFEGQLEVAIENSFITGSRCNNLIQPLKALREVVSSYHIFAGNDFCWRKIREYHFQKKLSGESLNILQEVMIYKVCCISSMEDKEHREKEAKKIILELSQNNYFTNMLTKIDDKTQLLAIRLLTGRDEKSGERRSKEELGLLPFMDANLVKDKIISEEIKKRFSAHGNDICRRHFYLLIHDIYEQFNDLFFKGNLHQTFVSALTDRLESIRILAFQWWHTNLPKEHGKRLEMMLENMKTGVGDDSNWHCNASTLLLELCKISEEYEKPIFADPLEDKYKDGFKDMNISTAYRGCSLPMTPMFSSSSQSLSQWGSQGSSQSQFAAGGILATQQSLDAFGFETEDADEKANDFFNMQTGQAGTFASIPASLMARDDGKRAAIVASIRKGEFATPGPKGRLHASDSFDSSRRLKSQTQKAKHFSRIDEEKNEVIKRSKGATAKKVMMLRRSYRSGEVPDIESLKLDDIITTLQQIVQLDSSMAKTVLVRLHESIPAKAKKPTDAMDTDDDGDRRKKMGLCIEGFLGGILQNRDQSSGSSDLVEALLDLSNVAGIRLNASIVAEVCTRPQCCTFYQGIRALEKQSMIDSKQHENPVLNRKRPVGAAMDQKKKNRAALDLTDDDQLQLSRLYEKLGETDVVLGLCEMICKLKQTRDSLEFELLGEHEKAVEGYVGLLKKFENVGADNGSWDSEERPSDLERQQWEDGVINCMRSLSKWDQLLDWIKEKYDKFEDDIWKKEYRTDLQHSMRSLVGLCSRSRNEFVDFVEDCWKNADLADRKKILRDEFGLETSLALLLDSKADNTVDAKELIKREIERFLREWVASESMGDTARRKKLRVLQRMVELEEYIQMYETDKQPGPLIQMWNTRIPSRHDNDNDAWNYFLTSRIALMQKMLREQGSDTSEAQGAYRESIAKLYLSMSRVARTQGSTSLAYQYLDSARVGGASEILCSISGAKLALIKSRKAPTVDVGFEMLTAACNTLDEIEAQMSEKCQVSILKCSARDKIKIHALKSQIHGQLLVQKGDGMTVEKRCDVKNMFKAVIEEIGAAGESCSSLKPKVHLRLALFCDTIMSRAHRSGPDCSDFASTVSTYIDSMLHAIASGLQDARAHFPRVLNLMENNFSVASTAVQKLRDVPSWMFLEWLPQIFSLVARKEPLDCAQCLIDCIERVAEHFPQAVYYSFRVVRDDIAKHVGNHSRLLSITSSQSGSEKLCRALQLLQNPELQIKTFLENILVPMSGCDENYHEIQVAFVEIYEDCLSGDASRGLGQLRIRRMKEFKGIKGITKLIASFREEGDSVKLKKNLKQGEVSNTVRKIQEALAEVIKEEKNKKADLVPVSHYTSSLERCEALGRNDVALDIPGQDVDSFSRDEPDNTSVKLLSCDPNLRQLPSLMRPKRLIMRGSDGREYWWLVKGGEDLRQDQRVQQVFRCMNRVLGSDSQCVQRGLSIQTYKVVPISKLFGIVEWVQGNDKPLGSLMDESLTHRDPEIRTKTGNTIRKLKELFLGDPKLSISQNYQKIINNAHSDEFAERVQTFDGLAEEIPRFLLRDALMAKAQTAQLEFEVRSNFARSLSASNCCQYILGIGDRHTSNLLISDVTGEILPIDFGHAFGSAIQLLPVPELMPMRLTRQLADVLAPLDPEGLLKRSMTYVMSALRTKKDLIRRTMEIFASDPTIDWARHAVIQGGQMSGTETKQEAVKGFVESKMKAVEEKLDGVHPAVVMRHELEKSKISDIQKNAKAEKSGICRIIEGSPHSVRNKLLQESKDSGFILNPKQQVDALVDQAMDSSVMACTWVGWDPYK